MYRADGPEIGVEPIVFMGVHVPISLLSNWGLVLPNNFAASARALLFFFNSVLWLITLPDSLERGCNFKVSWENVPTIR